MSQPSLETRLVEAAIAHFGAVGLHGASTRAIARDANTPMSSITYHFGGKQGLYLAAADHIAARMSEQFSPAIVQVTAAVAADPSAPVARRALQTIIANMIDVLVRSETAAFSRFIIREQAEPTEAFNRIYEGAIRQMLEQFASLLQIVANRAITEHEARVRAITLAGQVLVFRVARATALRGTGWDEIGADEAAEIKAAVAANLNAILDQLEAGGRA